MRTMSIIIISVFILVGIAATIVLNQPNFGKLPSGERLKRIEQSPNYRDGKFQNLSHTVTNTSDDSMVELFYKTFFQKRDSLAPIEPLQVVKTNLKELPRNSMVWLGHSSYIMNIENKNIVIDPVFNAASPFTFMVRPFEMSYNYSADDLPEIDLLIITHDHWDHLDYKTIKSIQPRVKKILCTLGVGEHLEYWGYGKEIIIELDWQESTAIDDFRFTCLPTRHFSGRGLQMAKTLWGSFMLETTEGLSIYIGGDSGYDTHFKDIGNRFKEIDLAILENGQYNNDWRNIHLLPQELEMAMTDLGARQFFAGHHSKYALARHSYTEPMRNIQQLQTKRTDLNIITPQIGVIVPLKNE